MRVHFLNYNYFMAKEIKKDFFEIDSLLGKIRGIRSISSETNESLLIFVSGYSQVSNPHLGRNRRIADAVSDLFSVDTIRFDYNSIGESDGSFYDLNTEVMAKNLEDIYFSFSNKYKYISFFTMSYGSNILRRFISKNNIKAHSTLMISPVFETIGDHYFLKIEDSLFTDFEFIKEKKYIENLKRDFKTSEVYKDQQLDYGKIFSFVGSEDFIFNLASSKSFFKTNRIDFEEIDGVNHGLSVMDGENKGFKNKLIQNKIIDKIGELLKHD